MADRFQKAPPLNSEQKATNSKATRLLFAIVFVTNLIVNIDHGILPAATTQLKQELDLDPINLGLIGSLVYLGLVIGSLIAMPVYHYMNTKFVIITCLILNSAALLLFTVGNNFYILCLSRVLVGVFQVFFCIYFPVWVDLFADESRKTIWLTTLLIGVPLGVITGYSLTAVLILYVNWKWTFYGQAFAMIPLALFFLMTPAKYMVYQKHDSNNPNVTILEPNRDNYFNLSMFSSKSRKSFMNRGSIINFSSKDQAEDSPKFGQVHQSQEDQSSALNARQGGFANAVENRAQLRERMLMTSPDPMIPIQRASEIPNYVVSGYNKLELVQLDKLERVIELLPFHERIKLIMSNSAFMTVLFSITFFFYISTAMQFWVTDYMQVNLGQSLETSFILFVSIAITGPIAGCIIGGQVIQYFGGYNDPRSLHICLIVSFVATSAGIPMPFVYNIVFFTPLVWVQFFAGGFMLPILTGNMLNFMPPSLRTTGNSVANLIQNLFGYLPGPFLWGLVDQYTGGSGSIWGLAFTQLFGAAASFLLIFTIITKKRYEADLLKQQLAQVGGTNMPPSPAGGYGPDHYRSYDNTGLNQKEPALFSLNSETYDLQNRSNVDYHGHSRISVKTPASEYLKLESMSIMISHSMFPISLGVQGEEDFYGI